MDFSISLYQKYCKIAIKGGIFDKMRSKNIIEKKYPRVVMTYKTT